MWGIAATAIAEQDGRPQGVTLPAAPRALLRLDEISKRWKSRAVLDGVGLLIAPGTLTWVGGRNGSGKTTLLRIAGGVIGPDAGTVALDGLHPRRDRREFHRRVGFLSAGDRGLYGRLTAVEHLELWARLALVPKPKVGNAIAETVDRLGIAALLPQRVDRLSMGQRQRMRLAMAFLHTPDVVLLDEPLTSLDEDGIAALDACLADLLGRGGAAVWCSPGVEHGQPAFDTRLWLEGARISKVRE